MKKPVPNPDSQNNLVRPVASKPDPRERALLEETLAAIREFRDLLRQSATDHEDKILPAPPATRIPAQGASRSAAWNVPPGCG